MTEPGGGYGWRAGGLLGSRRIAPPVPDRPLCVLLLPERGAQWAEPLEHAPGVVAVEPPRLSYRAVERLPDSVADGLAAVQARRLGLPGFPRAIVVFDSLQYRLARALIGIHPDAELWYGGAPHDLADARADLRFGAELEPLWERMERLGIESGRLGSERADVG